MSSFQEAPTIRHSLHPVPCHQCGNSEQCFTHSFGERHGERNIRPLEQRHARPFIAGDECRYVLIPPLGRT
jgi:hypothetical protein